MSLKINNYRVGILKMQENATKDEGVYTTEEMEEIQEILSVEEVIP